MPLRALDAAPPVRTAAARGHGRALGRGRRGRRGRGRTPGPQAAGETHKCGAGAALVLDPNGYTGGKLPGKRQRAGDQAPEDITHNQAVPAHGHWAYCAAPLCPQAVQLLLGPGAISYQLSV